MSESSYLAIGLMSGTSLDGVDVALLRTDGRALVEPVGRGLTLAYEAEFQAMLYDAIIGVAHGEIIAGDDTIIALEKTLTLRHAQAVQQLLAQEGVSAKDVSLIGFHGQTVAHDPSQKMTWQLGDGALLAAETGVDVVCDFRSADVAAGGQGAPLVPLYHVAIAQAKDAVLPAMFVNIGGVANVTYVGLGGEQDLLAFDTGPGNAALNDYIQEIHGEPYDAEGAFAAQGEVNEEIVAKWMGHPYFSQPLPKSLDRQDFALDRLRQAAPTFESLAPANAAATLTAFTARSIIESQRYLPHGPDRWYVCGGGRHNATLMRQLQSYAKMRGSGKIAPIERLGFDGDALEAQAFAYLAVRSRQGLPLSLPQTTGVPQPQPGGVFCPAALSALRLAP